MTAVKHWADALTLRREITGSAGQIADLQMSLYSAVYTNRDVPYQDPGYYSDHVIRRLDRLDRLLVRRSKA